MASTSLLISVEGKDNLISQTQSKIPSRFKLQYSVHHDLVTTKVG